MKKDITIGLVAFLFGALVLFVIKEYQLANFQQYSHKLFIIDQKIIGASDHAFVEYASCYEYRTNCDKQKLAVYIGKIEIERKQLLQQKKRLISDYPMIIPKEDLEIWEK